MTNELETVEAAGYATGDEEQKMVFRVKCITHRNNTIYNAILTSSNQLMRRAYLAATMSESSVMKHLTVDILMHGISEVAFAKGGELFDLHN